MAEQKTCPACGCKFEFIEGPNGKPIPVQKVRTIYVRGKAAEFGQLRKLDADISLYDVFVSHFETCSDPARFSRGGVGGG